MARKKTESSQRGRKSRAVSSDAAGAESRALEPEVVSGDEELEGDDLVGLASGEVLPPIEVDASVEGAVEGETSREVVPYDALTAYLREISRYPQISREDEFKLAVRYREHKDLDAAYKLVLANLWLVVKIARDYEAAARSLLDLVQEGNIGLMEAVKNFDPYKEVRFPSYAVWWIKAYIIRFVIANWRLVKIGTTQAQRKLFFNLKKEKERLEREGFSPMPKLIADRLNVRESDVVEMEQRLSNSEVSMDAPVAPDDAETSFGSLVASSDLNAEELLSRKQMKAMVLGGIEEFISTLNPKEAAIFRERLMGEEKVTLHDLAERFHLSKERIRQLENRLKERLKSFLIEKFGATIEHMDFEV